MKNVTRDQLAQMLQREGLELSQEELERLLPMVQQLGQKLSVFQSVNFGLEEIGGVFSPHLPTE